MKNILRAATMTALVFSACNNAPKAPEVAKVPEAPAAPAAAPTTPAAPTAAAGETTCYVYMLGKDVTSLQLTTEGDKVTGYMDWSPDKTDGGRGFLVGTKTGNMIVADWTYEIESDSGTEQVAFKIEGNKLMRAKSPLEEKGKKMVIKDMAKAKYVEAYAKVDCAEVAKRIGFAKDVEKTLKKK